MDSFRECLKSAGGLACELAHACKETKMTTKTNDPQSKTTGEISLRLPGWREFMRDWRQPRKIGFAFLGFAGLAILFPALAVPLAACSLVILATFVVGRRSVAKGDHRRNSHRPDNCIFYVGNTENDAGIWLSADECRSGILVSGTAHGRNNALLHLAENAFALDSGMTYVVGGSDVTAFSRIYSLAERYGRLDDLQVLNFMTGGHFQDGFGNKSVSNTLNPFASGSSDSLIQMIASLMDGDEGDHGMWKGRAVAMLTGVLQALTWLRDNKAMNLDVGTIRDHIALGKIVELADPTKFPDMPPSIRKSIKSYLTSLPGYKEVLPADKQSNTTLDHHGYLQMQFTKILGSLADVYGHIFLSEKAQIDISDVILNRRILVVMLPTLNKSHKDVADLFALIVETFRTAASAMVMFNDRDPFMSAGKIVSKRASPFTIIFDDFERYATPEMASLVRSGHAFNVSFVLGCDALERMIEGPTSKMKFLINSCAIRITLDEERVNHATLAYRGTQHPMVFPGQFLHVAATRLHQTI